MKTLVIALTLFIPLQAFSTSEEEGQGNKSKESKALFQLALKLQREGAMAAFLAKGVEKPLGKEAENYVGKAQIACRMLSYHVETLQQLGTTRSEGYSMAHLHARSEVEACIRGLIDVAAESNDDNFVKWLIKTSNNAKTLLRLLEATRPPAGSDGLGERVPLPKPPTSR